MDLLDQLKDKYPEWHYKIIEETGKEFNVLFSSFSEKEIEQLLEECPAVKNFEA